jgi:hypothetical protein
MEKALNEMTLVIKRAWIDSQMEQNVNDNEKINELFEAKRNIRKLKIKIGGASL